MTHALIDFHTENYRPLADMTLRQNKMPYAKRHGYTVFSNDLKLIEGVSISYQKIYMIREIMNTCPDIEWMWYTGTDSLVTNMSIRIEDKIDNRYHFMMSADFNGINIDSFLIRNTHYGRAIIDQMIAHEVEACKCWDSEQRAMAWTLGVPVFGEPWHNTPYVPETSRFANIARIYPQTYMNSYNYELYYDRYLAREQGDYDVFGYRGNWTKGDWLIHWPGTTLDQRMQLAPYYLTQVVE